MAQNYSIGFPVRLEREVGQNCTFSLAKPFVTTVAIEALPNV